MNRIASALACVVCLVAPLAHAGDGALEINTACVAAGCFEGDAPGFPVSITASGSYRLTSNLSVPSSATTVISVAVAHVTLDLGGFSISGPVTCTGTPAACTGGSAGFVGMGVAAPAGFTTVRNGIVRGMNYGVAAGPSSRVEGVIAESNANSGISGSWGSDGWLVDRCTARGNGAEGIRLDGGTGVGSLVTQSVVRGNATIGVKGNIQLTHSSVTNNGDFGASGNPYLLGNVFVNNKAGANTAQTNGAYLLGNNWCGTDATCP